MKKYARMIAFVLIIVMITGCSHSETDDNTPIATSAPLTETPILTEVAEPTGSSEPIEVIEPTESPEPTEVTKPPEVTEPTENPEPTEMVEPTESPEPTEVAEPTESLEPTELTEPTESPEPTEMVEPTESPEPTEVAEPTESPESTEVVEPTESPEPTEAVEPTESPEPTEVVEPTESPEPTEVVEPTESPEPTEVVEPTESPEPTEVVEPTENPELTEVVEPTESPELTEVAEPTESPKPTEVAETTESPEPTEVAGLTETPTPTASPIPTVTPMITVTPSPTATPKVSPTPTSGANITPYPNTGIAVIDGEVDPVLLKEQQKNAIAWLNYLIVIASEINKDYTNRMFLEEIYNALLDNSSVSMVDDYETQTYIADILETIHKYRMVSIKRDRLQYIYEQSQAKAIRSAIPNPLGLISVIGSGNVGQLITSVAYMSVDSVTSYFAYKNDAEQEYLMQGWELDDEIQNTIHNSSVQVFRYMVDICNKYNLGTHYALKDSDIQNFVKYKNETKNINKLQFLESNQEVYKDYGEYWLELAKCYYNNGNYEKCIDCIGTYSRLDIQIFRNDYYLAQTIPYVIDAIKRTNGPYYYRNKAQKYLDLLIKNTDQKDWSLRYFAAQVYIDFYKTCGNEKYLDDAYDIIVNCINMMLSKQHELNINYLNDVHLENTPKDANDETEQAIKDYNKSIKEKRKTELPPVYEPLVLNCDFLFSILDEKELILQKYSNYKTESERLKYIEKKSELQKKREYIDKLLHGEKDDSLFLTTEIDNKYKINKKSINVDADFDGDRGVLKKPYITIPVTCVSENSKIKAIVTTDGKETVYDDWYVDSINRTDDISSYTVTYMSNAMDNHKWAFGSKIRFEITEGENYEPITLNFKTAGAKVIPNPISDIVLYYYFEQVK